MDASPGSHTASCVPQKAYLSPLVSSGSVLFTLTILATATTFYVRLQMLESFNERPYGFILPIIAVAGLARIGYFNLKEQHRVAFLSSSAYIIGMLTSTVFGLYPNVLTRAHPDNRLTIYNAPSSYGQSVGLI